jgi:hypothetical protein
MKSFDIVTLTVSPALDKSAHFSGLVPEQKFVVKRLCLMQEEAESTFLKRYPDSRKITCDNFWRIDRRMLKSFTRRINFLKPLKHEWDTGKFRCS